MIRSAKVTLKFANRHKLVTLRLFVEEYQRVVYTLLDTLWILDKVPMLLPKGLATGLDTWLSQRAIQAAGKQASGIVRGTRQKQKQRLFVINKLASEGKHKQARKLQHIYDEASVSKPKLAAIKPELDSRFVSIDLDNPTSFDGWLGLVSLGGNLRLELPFKRHKHLNRMLDKGQLKPGVRLSTTEATFMFDLPEPLPVVEGSVMGIDIGQKSTLSCSDGQVVGADRHGHTYQTICMKLAGKRRGSKLFGRTVRHRTNYVNWSLNQLNLSGISQVNYERIKYLRKGKRTSRLLRHWNYRELFVGLESKLETLGVRGAKLNPTYTSQRCSRCGWVRKSNRKGKLFRCASCGFTTDADLNASQNLALCLRPIGTKERLRHANRAGFFWQAEGQAPIVPDAHEATSSDKLL